MAINSLNLNSNYVSQVQPQPQTYAERTAEKKGNDRVREDVSKAAVVKAPPPTVNTNGQTVGTIISVKA